MAFLAATSDAPPLGSMLRPSDPAMADRHGFRLAVVRRRSPVDDGDLVFVEILA
jgi:hypothetical protein